MMMQWFNRGLKRVPAGLLALVGLGWGILAAPGSAAAQTVDFATQVRPIFAASCYKCHGPEKQKGEFRMDTAEAMLKGGESGPAIVAADPAKSDLFRRVTLPADHEDIMPPKGDPLKKEQTDLISQWITEGANFGDWKADDAATVAAAIAAAGGGADASTGSAPAAVVLPEVPAADPAALQQLTDAGALVMPLAQGTNLLTVSFQGAADETTDAQLALLTPVAQQVYELNLAGTKVTDAGLAPLAGLVNLRALHLEKTAVTDAALAHLKGLANLEYLNLYGTPVTDAGLAELEGLKNLKKLYLWQSKATDAGAAQLKAAVPAVAVDLGWKEPAQ